MGSDSLSWAGGFHASKTGGFGLFSIEEYLTQIGGSISVNSLLGEGTSVTLEVALAAAMDR